MSKTKKGKQKEAERHPLWWIRALSGPAFILGGWGVISTSYSIGVCAVYCGFALLLLEILLEPSLRDAPLVQRSLFVVVLFFASWFTLAVVFPKASIKVESYAMRHGNYSDGMDVGGIVWDSHFTELKVALTNNDTDDYQNLDVNIQPDKMNYRAVLDKQTSLCDINPLPGDVIAVTRNKQSGPDTVTFTKIGEGEVRDSIGNIYTRLAASSGYRLICGHFPAGFTVKITFALVAMNPQMEKQIRGDLLPSGGMTVSEWSGVGSFFEALGPRPFPANVTVTGGVVKNYKHISLSRVVKVENSN